MARARSATVVDLTPSEAFDLWTDVDRWPSFVDGFAQPEQVEAGWPAPGTSLVWRSVPTGRGRVRERVTSSEPGVRFATEVLEERLAGTQTLAFADAEDGGAEVSIELDYKLLRGGAVGPLVDLLFIRRAQNDALGRTLRRFAVEAAQQAAL